MLGRPGPCSSFFVVVASMSAKGAGLPSHLVPSEWQLLPAGASPVSDHAEEDIEEFGFCFFRLVGLQ